MIKLTITKAKRYIVNGLMLCVCMACALGVQAQTGGSKTRNAHAEAHKQQLAAARHTGLDKQTISKMVEADIEAREAERSGISAETDQLLNDLLSEARTHLGKRYARGSKGPNAFDCSGFSSYVFRQFGYKLSASSAAQYSQGEKIDRKDLRKGDLVFFTGRKIGNSVGHVGIVISAEENGDFKFIHAATSKGISISTCTGYYEGRYLGARRIIE